jgi:hypothetical protein
MEWPLASITAPAWPCTILAGHIPARRACIKRWETRSGELLAPS